MEAASTCVKGESSSTDDDLSTLVGDVVTKEMIDEERVLEEKAIKQEEELKAQFAKEEKDKIEEQCYKRLNLLLSRSSIYAEFMADKMKRDKEKEEKRLIRIAKQSKSEKQQKRKKEVSCLSSRKKSSLNVYNESIDDEDYNLENENIINNLEKNEKNLPDGQPSLVTGAVMHPYQIEGFEWLKTLFENGVNGILADEMGLGKTIQTIAFIAHLIEMGISGPFFVCGPLSTTPNWLAEFQRFAPNIPALLYHGSQEKRALMRSSILKKVKSKNVCCYPVIITSYQIALIDAKLLKRFNWKLLVIDEAHRIKNFQCKLVTSLKLYNASNRLLLTGTPLQNDLSELWSLLNFILPEIFDDLKVFESWFDITRIVQRGATEEIVAKEQERQIVSIIHQILTPFLLRRTKTEVKLKLPLKKEVIVHAPLTKLQQEYYTAVLSKTIQETVGDSRGTHFNINTDLDHNSRRKDVNFDHIYKMLEDNKFVDSLKLNALTDSKPKADIFAHIRLNLRNTTMLLRKICGHPYLISYPLDPATNGHKIDEDLIKSSGKFLVLDAMLPELKKRGHKILIFSQFVMMLEIIEDYCIYREYTYSILTGDMSLEDRQDEIERFNKSDDSFLFLISTRAGGLGINLAQADTVIIFDSDWNPQGDIQAQDRCHRIGQTKPVVVYRFMIPNTVDEKIIDRATAKRKLEKAIMKKGRFNSDYAKNQTKLTIEELIELLKASDLSGFVKTDDNCIFSPAELDRILDRSDMKESV